MRYSALTCFLLLLFVSGVEAQQSCVAAQCHAALVQKKTVHAATESCDNCHEATSAAHPQKGVKTFKLTQNLPELCSACHDPFGKKSDVHPPVKDGDCTTCHDPHSSDESKLLAQPLKDLCTTCHSDKIEFKNVHGPVGAGECTQCHTPHESDTPKLLVREGAQLCFACHSDVEEALKKKDVHPPASEGCTDCHNPHGSEHAKLLQAEGKELCFTCHSDMSDLIQKAKVVHPPVQTEKACASCHSPHASDNAKLLLKAGRELCVDCHKSIIAKNMTVLHGPIKNGGCTPCHNPHASANDQLLVKEFPTDAYVPYSDKEYELCFSCHNRDLLAFPDTSFATNFRDGEKNLHYVHVNQQKGRNCTFCHDVHGSAGPKLIAQSVTFGKWNLPIKFVKTENGGSCSPGCHQSKTYDRKNPVKK